VSQTSQFDASGATDSGEDRRPHSKPPPIPADSPADFTNDRRSPGLKSGSPEPSRHRNVGDFFTFTVRPLDAAAGADLVNVAKCDGSVQVHRHRASAIPLLAVALSAMFDAVLARTPVRPASESRGDLDGTVYWSRTIWPQSRRATPLSASSGMRGARSSP